MPVCDNSKTAPACIAMSPTTGEALSTTFTFTAGLWDSSTASGWNDPDGPDSSLMYRFGYLVEGSDTPVMLSSTFGAAGANTITSDTLPAGLITPVVIARDLVNGDSDMVVAATPVIICVTAPPCDASGLPTGNKSDADRINEATEALATKLDEQVENLASTPADVAANKNKLATGVQSVAASMNDVTSGDNSKAEATRTKMANTLKDAVLATTGPPLDVGIAASALASISANPEQLSSDAQRVIVAVIDGILAQASVISDGIDSEVAQNLVDAIGDTQQAITSGRRAATNTKMNSQLKSVTIAALMKTEPGGDALTFTGTGLSMICRKIPRNDIAGLNVGFSSVYTGWGFTMSTDSTVNSVPAGDMVLIQVLHSNYTMQELKFSSSALSISIWNQQGSMLSLAQGSMEVSFTLNTMAESPSCSTWTGSMWQQMKDALLTTSRTAGSVVRCTANNVGTFVVIDSCNSCSGNGECQLDGSCICKPGWTGQYCSTNYCDEMLFKCTNGGVCTCPAQFDCMAECLATSSCASSCSKKCAPDLTNYTVAACPPVQGTRQTTCRCPCGYMGSLCETQGEVSQVRAKIATLQNNVQSALDDYRKLSRECDAGSGTICDAELHTKWQDVEEMSEELLSCNNWMRAHDA